MGGSLSGGFNLDPDQLRTLEQQAQEALRKSAPPERRNVFISFAHEDLDEVILLRGQARNENSDLEFNDWSVSEPFDSKNADYIKRGIRERIRQSSVTVVYISEKTAASRWVDWEIRESIALGKGVIAMHKGESPPARLPAAITEHGIKVVPWNHRELSAAIDQAARQRQ